MTFAPVRDSTNARGTGTLAGRGLLARGLLLAGTLVALLLLQLSNRAAPSNAAAAAPLEVLWRLPGHESFDYSAFVDRPALPARDTHCRARLTEHVPPARSLFTPEQEQWLQHYKGAGRRQAGVSVSASPSRRADKGGGGGGGGGRGRRPRPPHAALTALREWSSVAREAAAARLLAQRPRDVLAGERLAAPAPAGEDPQTRAVVALVSAHGTYLSAAMDRRLGLVVVVYLSAAMDRRLGLG